MSYIILTSVVLFFVFRKLRKEFRQVLVDSKKGYTISVEPIELVYDIYSGVSSYLWRDAMGKFLETLGYSENKSDGNLNKGFYCIDREIRCEDNFYTERSYTLRVICKNLIDYLEIHEKSMYFAAYHRESAETLARREVHNDRLRSTGYF